MSPGAITGSACVPACVFISDAAKGTGPVVVPEEEHSMVLGEPTVETCPQRSCP